MDAARVRAYLQVACAGLGFDIGEIWVTSNENGSSTVAAIEEPSNTATATNKLRFVQLYTSKSFENRRGELVNPEDDEGTDDEPPPPPILNAVTTTTKKKHKLSPLLVDAISKSMKVVWRTSAKQEGLAGTSGIPLHTAVGMPVAMDNNGNMCCVVMFSPNSIASTDDAMDYLQNISQCATSASIPCLLPMVVPNPHGASRNHPIMTGGVNATAICKETQQQHMTALNASWGGGVAVQFASLDQRQRLHDMKEAPKDTFGIPMLPDFTEGEVFDEASYGVWTTIMEQALTDEDVLPDAAMSVPETMEPIRISEDCKTRMEEFLFAFLGLSSFDLADVWIYSPECAALQQFTSVTETDSLSGFQSQSVSAQIQTWEGAIGRAFASGDPVWTSDPNEFRDGQRASAFASSGIRTVLAVPVFSTQRIHPACVVACYALVPSRSVTFVLRFVQQALRLLWSGLDSVEPHGAVGRNLWQDVTPVCLGEMAADVEMQHHFMSKKRPLALMSGDGQRQDEQPVPLEETESSENSGALPTYQEVQNHLFDAVKSVAEAIPVAKSPSLQDSFHRSKRAHVSTGAPLLMPQPLPNTVIRAPATTQNYPDTDVPTQSMPSVSASAIHYPVSTQYCESAGATVLSPASGVALETNQPQNVSTTLAAQIAAAQMQNPVSVDPISFLTIIQNERQDPTPVPDNVASFLNPDDLIPNPVPLATYCPPVSDRPPVEPLCFLPEDTVRNCKIQGCDQRAMQRRPYCTKHSGNRLCEKPGCQKCAQGSTRFCIAHGGGRRCTFPGCDKGARDKFFCAAHGGGKRCQQEGCSKSAVGGSNRCTAHGGGRRCSVVGCSKSAQSSTNFCVKHGGGKKCSQHGCLKVARGRTQFCASHGGGVRCRLEGCNRVAIGKQQLCRTHGGFSSRANGGAES